MNVDGHSVFSGSVVVGVVSVEAAALGPRRGMISHRKAQERGSLKYGECSDCEDDVDKCSEYCQLAVRYSTQPTPFFIAISRSEHDVDASPNNTIMNSLRPILSLANS